MLRSLPFKFVGVVFVYLAAAPGAELHLTTSLPTLPWADLLLLLAAALMLSF